LAGVGAHAFLATTTGVRTVRTRSLPLALCINGTADRAGACHGDCLATAEPMTPMFFGYRSDRRPALAFAPYPVLECHRQTKHRVSAMAHLAVVSTNHTCPPSAQAAHDLRNILASSPTLEWAERRKGGRCCDALLTRGTALCNNPLDSTAMRITRRAAAASTWCRPRAKLPIFWPQRPQGLFLRYRPE